MCTAFHAIKLYVKTKNIPLNPLLGVDFEVLRRHSIINKVSIRQSLRDVVQDVQQLLITLYLDFMYKNVRNHFLICSTTRQHHKFRPCQLLSHIIKMSHCQYLNLQPMLTLTAIHHYFFPQFITLLKQMRFFHTLATSGCCFQERYDLIIDVAGFSRTSRFSQIPLKW